MLGVLVMASVKRQILERSQIRHCLSGIRFQAETKTGNVEGVFVQSWGLEAIADQVLPQSFYPWLPPPPPYSTCSNITSSERSVVTTPNLLSPLACSIFGIVFTV